MVFRNPWIILLIPVVVSFVFFVRRKQCSPSLRFPSASLVASLKQTWRTELYKLPFYLRLLAISFFIIALAGPRSVREVTIHEADGVDIVLALDASGSMAAEDFTIRGERYNRLAVVKDVVRDFIAGRRHDRIGLVAFGGLAYTVSPLTTDYAWLKTNLKRIELDLLEDGTAVGSAISSSLSRLSKSEAKSKIIILLTDGMNNRGQVPPLTAAEAAKALGVRIYTIGVGTKGYAPFPARDFRGKKVYQQVRIDLDEDTLQKIADVTEGQYFRATDTTALKKIYKEIDSLEKTKIEEFGYKEYKELFMFPLAGALILLLVGIVLLNTILLRLP